MRHTRKAVCVLLVLALASMLLPSSMAKYVTTGSKNITMVWTTQLDYTSASSLPINASYGGWYAFCIWGACGSAGHTGGSGYSTYGKGGWVKGAVYLTGGTTYYLIVGGRGGPAGGNNCWVAGTSGGGKGYGQPDNSNQTQFYGGGGGGYSGIFTVASVTNMQSAQAIVVAGGGGGGTAYGGNGINGSRGWGGDGGNLYVVGTMPGNNGGDANNIHCGPGGANANDLLTLGIYGSGCGGATNWQNQNTLVDLSEGYMRPTNYTTGRGGDAKGTPNAPAAGGGGGGYYGGGAGGCLNYSVITNATYTKIYQYYRTGGNAAGYGNSPGYKYSDTNASWAGGGGGGASFIGGTNPRGLAQLPQKVQDWCNSFSEPAAPYNGEVHLLYLGPNDPATGTWNVTL